LVLRKEPLLSGTKKDQERTNAILQNPANQLFAILQRIPRWWKETYLEDDNPKNLQ